MDSQRRLGIYVGFDSSSIIRFLETTMGDLLPLDLRIVTLMRHYLYRLVKDIQNIRDNDKHKPIENLTCCEQQLSHLDPRTSECENEIHRIIHLQNIANRLCDAFNDASKATKFYIPARIVIPEEYAKI